MNPSYVDPFQPSHVSPGLHLHPSKYALQEPIGIWTTGLCDCCDDYPSCFLSCFCPCVVVGRTAEIINGGTISCAYSGIVFCGLSYMYLGWLHSSAHRSRLRELFSLPELPYADWCLHCCCSPCAISQEYRELKNRGADVSTGWEANVEKWKQDGLIPPVVVLDMIR